MVGDASVLFPGEYRHAVDRINEEFILNRTESGKIAYSVNVVGNVSLVIPFFRLLGGNVMGSYVVNSNCSNAQYVSSMELVADENGDKYEICIRTAVQCLIGILVEYPGDLGQVKTGIYRMGYWFC